MLPTSWLAFHRAAFLLTLFTSSSVMAAEETHPATSPHLDHVIVGVKGVSTLEQASAHGQTLDFAGFGVAGVAERTLFHDRMSLELDLVYVVPGDERSLAVEPMTKLPWHINRFLEPYAAMGPLLLSIADGHGTHYWLGGGQLVVGSLFWLAELMGLDFDLALGAARGTGMTMLEASFAIGPVLRH